MRFEKRFFQKKQKIVEKICSAYASISVKALFLTVFLATAAAICPAAEEPLIYDENCWVTAELSVPSPNGEWAVVYSGIRHKEAAALQRVREITLRHRDGRQYALETDANRGIDNIVLQPWSPDGMWLALQPGRHAGFLFYPVDKLPLALLNGGICLERVKHRGTPLFCEKGSWAADGSFSFQAGLSGDTAPYSARISEETVQVKRTGEFKKTTPAPRVK